jgi:hypothetical protein
MCITNNVHKQIKSLIHRCADQHNAQSNDTAQQDWTYMVVLKIMYTCVNLVATSLLITGNKLGMDGDGESKGSNCPRKT